MEQSVLTRKIQEMRANLSRPDELITDIPALEYELSVGREIEAQPRPRVYQVEVTSRCNLKCPFCPRTHDLAPNNKRNLAQDMSVQQFLSIVDRMPWLKSIELFHFGEPFLVPNLDRYIRACTQRGISTTIASNLLPATAERLNAAFDSGLSFLVIDLDSLDPKRYAEFRPGGNLDVLRKHIIHALKHPGPKPFIVLQTINLTGTPEYTYEELLDWTGGLEPDEFRCRFLDSFRGTTTEQKKALGPDDICREPFYGFSVHVNGNVVPCNRDWAGEAIMGNLFHQSIEEIWNGAPFRTFREQMKSDVKPSICRTCDEGLLINGRSQPKIQVNMFRGMEVQR